MLLTAAFSELALQALSLLARGRAEREPAAPAAGALRILCLGESTTAAPPAGPDGSWPAQLQSLLDAGRPGRYWVLNKGRAGTSSSLILARLPDYLGKYRPDLVIAMVGVNDDQWFALRQPDSLLRRLARHSRLVRLALHTRDFSRRPLPAPQAPACLGEQACRRAIALEPERAEGYASLAVYLMEHADDARAGPLFEEAYRKGSRDSRVLFYVASLYDATGRRGEASRALAAVGADGNESPLLQVARFYAGHDRSGEAARAIQEAAQREPDFSGKMGPPREASSARGVTAENLRRIAALAQGAGARFFAMQYPTLDAGDLKALFADGPTAVLVENRKNFERALSREPYDRIFADAFGGGWGHTTPEGSRLIAENVLAAMTTAGLVDAKEGSGPNAPRTAGRGAALLKFAGLARERPGDPDVWIEQADADRQAGQRALALAGLGRARMLARDPARRRRIALMDQELGDYDDALDILTRLTRETPTDASLWKDAGICQYRAGKSAQAQRSLREALRLDPGLLEASQSLKAILAAP